MKAKQWIGIIFVLSAILSGCTNNRRVIVHPAFVYRNTNVLEINKVELNDTATVLYMKAYKPPKGWIQIDSLSFLTDNQGKKYAIRTIEGITLGEQYIMPDSGNVAFKMIFPPVASNAVSVDFSEGDAKGAWNIWGIQLTNKPFNVSLPKDFKEAVIDKNAVLPPVEFKAGKARLEGQILNFRPGMLDKVSVWVASPVISDEVIFPVDSTGKFSGDIDALSVHPISCIWMTGGEYMCFIAPGDTTSLIINPSGRKSGDNPSMGEPVYYGGYLASLSTEFSQINDSLYTRNYKSYASYLQFLDTKTPETFKVFFDEYQAKKAALDTLDVSPACKQLLYCYLNFSYASDITNIPSAIDRAYIVTHQLQNDRKAMDKYYATRKLNLPDDFYNVLKDFSIINEPQILYALKSVQTAYPWQMQNMQPVLSKALGTDKGTLFDMMKVIGASNDINNFKPVSEAQIAQLPAVYQEFIKNKNDELLKQIEANKNKAEYTENVIPKIADKDIFPFILSKFKGRPVLLDFWATWCVPCRIANEELKPVKAELENKGIVYVYVAGENSPLETWKNMIPNLHGEHFRLTAKQWSYILDAYGIEGVPTYFFIDREGNVKEKIVGYSGVQKMKEKMLNL